MLLNPFIPSHIASDPQDFFGRQDELRTLARALHQGSVAIHGAIGIGKSSMLARARLMMEGFESPHQSVSVICVGDKDVQTLDQAARLVLESLVSVDERQTKVSIGVPKIIEIESTEICRNFIEGRHLAVLKRIVEKQYISSILAERNLLILAIDEADKCPVPLAGLVRAIITQTQHHGVMNVRFVLAGVSPFFQKMVDADAGINRFFYQTISLEPMSLDDAADLMDTKLAQVAESAEQKGISLKIDDTITDRVVRLSGGHPHILQLLGSHLVEHENEDPDGIIDARDLMGSLKRICYEDRARVYNATLHELELSGKRDALVTLLELASNEFPTRIARKNATEAVGKDVIEWLANHNVLSLPSPDEYGLVDEFIRVRIKLDAAVSEDDRSGVEGNMVRGRRIRPAAVDENSDNPE